MTAREETQQEQISKVMIMTAKLHQYKLMLANTHAGIFDMQREMNEVLDSMYEVDRLYKDSVRDYMEGISEGLKEQYDYVSDAISDMLYLTDVAADFVDEGTDDGF